MNRPLKVITTFGILAMLCAAGLANNLYFLSGIDIKNSGMAGSSSPFTTGVFSGFSNPAGLGGAESQELGFLYYNLFEGAVVSAVSYAHPLLERGTFTVSGVILNSGDIEQRDADNVLSMSFSDSFRVLYLSYGIKIFPFLSAGFNLKYLDHEFYSISSSAFGADIGAIACLPQELRLSVFAGNIIKPEFSYASASDTLPLFYDACLGWEGALIDSISGQIKMAAGISGEEYSSSVVLHAGVEYSLLKMFSLRAGLSSTGFSAGVSARFNRAEINYCLIQAPLDLVHRFSVSYSFGENIRALESQLKTKEDKAKYELIEQITRETVARYEDEINELIKAGDYENAKTSVTKALIWSPEDPNFIELEMQIDGLLKSDRVKTYLADADTFMKQDLYIDALVSLRNVLDLDPTNRAAAEKFKRAQELTKTLGESNLSVESGNKQAIKQHFESGLDSYTSGNYVKAVEEWDKVIQASPLQRQVYDYIKRAQDKIKKKEEAVSQKKASEDRILSGLYKEAVKLYTKGEFEKSISLWRDILKADPQNKEAKDYLDKITKEYLDLQKQKLEW